MKIYRGPEIIWNRDEILKMSKAFGWEGMIERLSAEFNKKFLRKTLETIMIGKKYGKRK